MPICHQEEFRELAKEFGLTPLQVQNRYYYAKRWGLEVREYFERRANPHPKKQKRKAMSIEAIIAEQLSIEPFVVIHLLNGKWILANAEAVDKYVKGKYNSYTASK